MYADVCISFKKNYGAYPLPFIKITWVLHTVKKNLKTLDAVRIANLIAHHKNPVHFKPQKPR